LLEETGDLRARRAAAEALERFGLLRRRRSGPSTMFVWLVTMALFVCAAAAWSSLGPPAGVAFGIGAGALGVVILRRLRRPSSPDEVFVGPHGDELVFPR
jgi:hypothetical protein